MSIKYYDKSGTTPQEVLLAGISPVDQILNGTSKNAIANKAVYNALKEKIDKTVSDLVNYYSKADVYNKAEVRALISTISTMDIQVVNALPTEDISTTTIYFLKPAGATTYDEYVYINNAWVKIGTTDLDLSQYVTNDALTLRFADYYTKAEIDTLLAQYALKDNVYDKDAVDALLDAKQDSLTFDNAPTKNSNNVVKSGGIYSTVDNVYKMMGENGTKNLLPSSNSSGTRLGITFTKQNDGSWIAKGSTTSSSATYWDIINPSVPFTLKPGKYILSSGANLTSEIELVLDDITSGSQVRIATLISEKEVAFTLNAETTIKCYMWVKDTTTLPTEGIHYYPMIRLASDTDSTYQPYAMTNRELTEVKDIFSDITLSSSVTNNTSWTYASKLGNVVTINISFKVDTAIAQYGTIASGLPAPKLLTPLVASKFDSTSSSTILYIDPSGNLKTQYALAANNSTIYCATLTYIV